ncbi:MAG: 3-hydroxyacyl-CoA dehydrogenase family protein [Gammaproteobacteria bacterium SHHR-1]
MTLSTIGVIGSGVMGSGVAQDLAQHNMSVVLVDISERALEKAKQEIHRNVRFAGLMQPGSLGGDPDQVLARIQFTTELEALADVDFLIENVVEKWEVKQDLYQTIDPIVRKDCIFAADTSAISITRIASLTQRPERVIGMHFMNPVPMKAMVELIRGFHTSEETIQTAKVLLKQMGKDAILVNDMPGFVSNRVLMLMVNEAAFLVQDQVAEAADVDKIFKSCFGHKMGPLETIDLIGVDTILYSLEVLYESYNDPKYRPCPLLKKMTYAGLLGRKSGQGFYKYPLL